MSKFRTTSISDPKFESDGLRFITVKTTNLWGRGDICVFVPKGVDLRQLPIVILLHGVYGSAWVWSQKGGAHQVAQSLIDKKEIQPMVLAMPSDGLWGDGSAYLPHNNLDFEKWVSEDVPAAIQENIPEVSITSVMFISGLSMGGFGALKIGSKYAHLFKGISAHSSITSIEQMKLFVEEPLENYRQKELYEEDVFQSILKNSKTLPALRFDCGKDDLLIEHNRKLHSQLRIESIPHEYTEFDGGHEWSYWHTHLVDTLLFFQKILIT